MGEVWKPISGYEDRYEISSTGRVRSKDRAVQLYNGGTYVRQGRILTPTKDTFGHLQIRLCGGDRNKTKMMLVHRLVAEAFIGKDHRLVRHLNGDPTDNRVENLAYGTARENSIDCLSYGVSPSGSKLLSEDVVAIRNLLNHGLSQQKIANLYGVNQSCISKIKTGKTYSYVGEKGGLVYG